MKKQWIAGLLLAGSVWMLAGCGSTELDLTQYVKVKFDGVDGKGYVESYEIDSEELDDALKDANEDLSKKERQKLIQSIDVSLKKDSQNLSNGDKVKVEIDWSERKAERYNLVFKGDEKEVKVSGLKELEKIDAFKDIELKYSGASPFVTVEVKNNSKNAFLKNCYYSVDYGDDAYCAGIGDEIELSVSYSDYDAEQEGYMVEEDTKKMKLKEGDVDAYVTDPAEISGDALKEMVTAAESIINERYFDDSYRYRSMMGDITGAEYNWDFDMATVTRSEYKLDKIAILVAKDVDHGKYQYNMPYFIFETTVQDSVNVNPVTVYCVASFEDVILCTDGTIDVDLEDVSAIDAVGSLEDVQKLIDDKTSRTYDVTQLDMN